MTKDPREGFSLTERPNMLIQLNTDNHVEEQDKELRTVKSEIQAALARFATQITRVEVYFRDANAQKHGSLDKECTIEVRLAGKRPTAVTHAASALSSSFHGALTKITHVLQKRVAKTRPPRGIDRFERAELEMAGTRI